MFHWLLSGIIGISALLLTSASALANDPVEVPPSAEALTFYSSDNEREVEVPVGTQIIIKLPVLSREGRSYGNESKTSPLGKPDISLAYANFPDMEETLIWQTTGPDVKVGDVYTIDLAVRGANAKAIRSFRLIVHMI